MKKTNGHSNKIEGGKNALAKVGDPLIAPDGSLLEQEEDDDDLGPSRLPPPSTAVPFADYRPTKRRVISDLRAEANSINVANVVLIYTLLGISDAEIAEVTNLESDKIEFVRASRVYSEIFECVMRELINANSEYIECRLSAYSGMALNNVAEIAQRARNTGYRLTASKDLLDRAGHRAQDAAGRQMQGMNELHIVITTPKDQIETSIDFNCAERNFNLKSKGEI